jgi:hypothetical protein
MNIEVATKFDALEAVQTAAAHLATRQPGSPASNIEEFRSANRKLAVAQLYAAQMGASSQEITESSEWEGPM